MGFRNVGLAVVMSVSILWAQEGAPGQGQQPPTPAPQPSPGTERPQPGREQPQPGQQQPRFPGQDDDPFSRDPFNRGGRGLSGRIMPAPSYRLRVDLYVDSMRMDTTITEMDGSFRFERQQPGNRYELRIDLGNGFEYVEEVDFMQGFPTTIHIQERGIRRTEFAGNTETGSGTIISLASLRVPKDAAKEFDKARKASRKKKYDEALQRLQKAVEVYPQYAEAFNEMGMLYRQQNRNQEARQAFEQAISADPNWVFAYVNLASLQMFDKQAQQLLETSNKILQLYPTLSPGHFFHSYANLSLGRLEEAEKSALKADSYEHAQVPQIHLLLASIYRHRGELEKAEKQLRTYLKENPQAPNAEQVRADIAKLQQQKEGQRQQAGK